MLSESISLVAALGVGGLVGIVITQIMAAGQQEYDHAFDGYLDLLKVHRHLIAGQESQEGIRALAEALDRVWLYGSPEVINAFYRVVDRSRSDEESNVRARATESDALLIGRLVEAMRMDLARRRPLLYRMWPQRQSPLTASDYQLIGPAPGVPKQ